jgi:hypothetical protein
MDFPFEHSQPAPFPWRTAALVAAAVAAVELIVLVVVAGGSLLPTSGTSKPAAQTKAPAKAAKHSTTATKTTAASLPRRKVSIVILNGNGRDGAASSAAARVQRRGYRIKLVGNAPRQDYPSSIVMYRPGFMAEGRRLGRDLGIRLVTPLDGMRPSQLHGAHTVVVLGG